MITMREQDTQLLHMVINDERANEMNYREKLDMNPGENHTSMRYLLIIIKLCVIFSCAMFLDLIFSAYTRFSFGIGFILGVILQHQIPPRSTTKRFLLLLAFAIAYAIARPLLVSKCLLH